LAETPDNIAIRAAVAPTTRMLITRVLFFTERRPVSADPRMPRKTHPDQTVKSPTTRRAPVWNSDWAAP
jgi:hypothetical protein